MVLRDQLSMAANRMNIPKARPGDKFAPSTRNLKMPHAIVLVLIVPDVRDLQVSSTPQIACWEASESCEPAKMIRAPQIDASA